jgi:glucose-6-phosphate isomerase
MSAVTHALALLEMHWNQAMVVPLAKRFEFDPQRFSRFHLTLGLLLVDFSKQLVEDDTLRLLADLARAAELEEQRAAMFAGQAVNTSEGRPALHVALRAGPDADYRVDGRNVVADVQAVLKQMADFAGGVRSGAIAGAGGAFTDVLHLGIGGSDLGPAMAVRALSPCHDGPRVHFVANVDGTALRDTLAGLDPRRTLVLVASKTFTTVETMTNAAAARAWLKAGAGEKAVAGQMAAISVAAGRVAAFGIAPERTFAFWDWVGGRFSLWSAIGLPIMMAVGPDRFAQLLAGGREMDEHFRTAPLRRNIPVVLGLIDVFNHVLVGLATRAVVPYDQRLERFPAFLQQLEMESNGKRVTLDGQPAGTSGVVVFGEPGTNAQHAFFQLLHQGVDVVPVDFLVAANADIDTAEARHQQALLIANCFAQGEALMRGRSLDDIRAAMAEAGAAGDEIDRLAPHRVLPGNRPSTTMLYPRLDPHMLGMLIALHEHRVFVQAAVLGLNPFDQWGVEFGKSLAAGLLPLVEGKAAVAGRDSSTTGLVEAMRAMRTP